MTEHGPEFERENNKLGLMLFGLFVLLLAVFFAVGFIYLAVF
jgi:hypothetical protein